MPDKELIIREVTKSIWTFSRPFARFGLWPIGGRSTAIKLKDGGVWLLASTPLSDETKARLDALGPVKYIVGPDSVHYLFLGQYKKAYPDAKLLGVAESSTKLDDKSIKFDGVWGNDAPDTKYGFEDDIKYCFFSGHRHKEVAFLHVESKTLIEADLLFNLPANEQYSKSNSWLFGNVKPTSWLHQKMISGVGINKEEMKRDVQTVASWDFDRIIPCHGDVIEKGGKKAWRDAYKAFLD